MNTLVIGYGNTLRSDDGVGSFVAKCVGENAVACHQLTPELAETISQAARVIFVDAHAGIPAGEIRIDRLRPHARAATHRCDPETLLGWAEQLYGRAPEAILLGIGAESFDLGESLSPGAERGALKALRVIRQLGRPSPWYNKTVSMILASSHWSGPPPSSDPARLNNVS